MCEHPVLDDGPARRGDLHAPCALVEAGVLTGKQLTSWPSLKTDIRNAGAMWVDLSGCTTPRTAGRPKIEARWQRYWAEHDIFRARDDGTM